MGRYSPACGGLCLAAFFCLSGTPGPPGFYQIIDLGTLGGLSSVALGINNLGQVVGGADLANGKRHAFLWDNGVMIDLGVLPGRQYAEAWDVNNLGAVCGGSSASGEAWTPFVWQGGVMTALPHLSGQPTGDSTAFALNDAGQIVGTSNTAPVLWENGSVISLFTTYGVGGVPWDINNLSQVASGDSLLQLDTGADTFLGTLGGNVTQAFGLNNNGQVVGWSERLPGEAVFHAFLWADGVMIDIGSLEGYFTSSAEAVNRFGVVVGIRVIATETGGDNGAFIFTPTNGVRDLESMIPANSGWSDLSARDVNDASQIVGAGTINGFRHAFLMNPAPVPAVGRWGLVVLAAAIVGLAGRLVRRGKRSSTVLSGL
ncbi:MAG: hypothetical protein HY763_09590 [Planctomycetes bacterium]|nr:hypothetical protein [Planctomycetota bacterium]